MRFGGQYTASTGPTRLPAGTGPQTRESHDCLRLSPITKYCPGGTAGQTAVCASRSTGST